MNNIKTYKAAPGRVVFFPSSVATSPGGRPRSLRGEETIDLDSTLRFVVRYSKPGGDLELVKPKQPAKRKDK